MQQILYWLRCHVGARVCATAPILAALSCGCESVCNSSSIDCAVMWVLECVQQLLYWLRCHGDARVCATAPILAAL